MAQIHLKAVVYLDTKLKGTQNHKHMKVLNTEFAPNVQLQTQAMVLFILWTAHMGVYRRIWMNIRALNPLNTLLSTPDTDLLNS